MNGSGVIIVFVLSPAFTIPGSLKKEYEFDRVSVVTCNGLSIGAKGFRCSNRFLGEVLRERISGIPRFRTPSTNLPHTPASLVISGCMRCLEWRGLRRTGVRKGTATGASRVRSWLAVGTGRRLWGRAGCGTERLHLREWTDQCS